MRHQQEINACKCNIPTASRLNGGFFAGVGGVAVPRFA